MSGKVLPAGTWYHDGWHVLDIQTHTADVSYPVRYFDVAWDFEPMQRHTVIEDISPYWQAVNNYFQSPKVTTFPTMGRNTAVENITPLGIVSSNAIQQQQSNQAYLTTMLSQNGWTNGAIQ